MEEQEVEKGLKKRRGEQRVKNRGRGEIRDKEEKIEIYDEGIKEGGGKECDEVMEGRKREKEVREKER